MIESLEIDGFRGLDGVSTGPLARFNVIVGPGGTGKTSLLEAAFGFGSAGAAWLHKILAMRGLLVSELLPPDTAALLSASFSAGRASLSLRGTWDRSPRVVTVEARRSANLQVSKEDPYDLSTQAIAAFDATCSQGERIDRSTLYVTPARVAVHPAGPPLSFLTSLHWPGTVDGQLLAASWSRAIELGSAADLTALLKELHAGFDDIHIVASAGGRAVVRVRKAGLLFAPELLGRGFAQSLEIATHMRATPGGVALFDEIDAALHIGALRRVIAFLVQGARSANVQVLCTTHSLETLDAFLDATADQKDLCVLQMRRGAPARERLRNVPHEDARFLRDELGTDLRYGV